MTTVDRQPSPKSSARRFAVALLASIVMWAGVARADDLELKSAPIMARAVAYDYNLKARAGTELVVAVLFKPGDAGSEATADRWLAAFSKLAGVKLQGLPLKAKKLPFTSGTQLSSEGHAQSIDVVLVGDGLDGDVGTISRIAQERQWLSIGTRERHVSSGLALAVFNEGGRNVISVSLPACEKQGVNFASDLLRLARVLR